MPAHVDPNASHSCVYRCRMLSEQCWLSGWLSVLNKSQTVSPAKHPHTITPLPPCFTVGTTHAEIIRSPTLRLTKTRRLEPKISNLDSSDQRTDLHQSNVNCSCFLTQENLFFLLVLVVVSLQQFDPEGMIHAVYSEQLMLSVTWTLWSIYLRLVTLMNVSSTAEVISIPVAVLMRASLIKAIAIFRIDLHVLK